MVLKEEQAPRLLMGSTSWLLFLAQLLMLCLALAANQDELLVSLILISGFKSESLRKSA